MSEGNYLIYFLNKVQENPFLRTKKGLFFVFIFIFLVTPHIFRYIVKAETIPYISLSICIIYFFWWLYFSGRLFFSSKIKICFAIELGEKAKEYHEQIIRTINSKIDELDLSRAIEIKKMPSDILFLDHLKAERYVKSRMIDLLIWGFALEGNLEDSQISEFKLKFTYLYRVLPERIRKIFIRQIDDSLKGRYWRILDEKSFGDIQVVSGNITEISLFIIGLCLYTRGELIKSLQIYEKIKSLLEHRAESTFPGLVVFKEQVDQFLIEGYRFFGISLRDNNPEESKKYYEKVFNIKPDDSGAHLDIAKLCYVLDNDLDAARAHTDKVTDPFLRPLTNYNYAFFAIKEKNPRKVLAYYQQIKGNPSANIIEIIGFLQNEFAKDPSNILYHFALGYINVYHCDVKVGMSELEKFIEKARGLSEYRDLVINATALLENRRKKWRPKVTRRK